MIQSKVLSSYSPLIVPVSFIFGLKFIENDIIYGKLSLLGMFLFSLSLFLFSVRIKDIYNEETFYSGIGLFIFSYILLKYSPNLYKFSTVKYIQWHEFQEFSWSA